MSGGEKAKVLVVVDTLLPDEPTDILGRLDAETEAKVPVATNVHERWRNNSARRPYYPPFERYSHRSPFPGAQRPACIIADQLFKIAGLRFL